MKKWGLCFVLFVAALSLLANDVHLIGATAITPEKAKEWARQRKATEEFINLADLYWELAPQLGINPVVAYCQAAKETGYGHFGGKVKPWFKNPCGLKRGGAQGDTPDDHMCFDSWEDGVNAHLDHIALYIGLAGYPKAKTATKDPRHDKWLYKIASTVMELGKRWASSENYGRELVRLIKTLEPDGY